MAFSANTKTKLKTVIIVSLAGIIIGPLFTGLAFGFTLDRILKGVIGGFVILSISSLFEAFAFQEKFKKLKFTYLVIIKTIFYIVLISFAVMMVWLVHESSVNEISIIKQIQTDDFKYFLTKGDFPYVLLFCISISLLINFFVQLNYLLGKGVLLNYITGKYHKPVSEQRIFMFLDLESSTTIAEKIGPIKYHELMNNYFFDLNDPIIETKGEIYQYVGDEVVVSWTISNGIKNSNCIKCFFDIKDKIDLLSEKYKKDFGLVPGFKAGIHYGEVVIGEVGDSKKEIVFHGDVMNTASRIQAQSKVLNLPIVISWDLLTILNLDKNYLTEEIGKFTLKGKEQEVKLYKVERV